MTPSKKSGKRKVYRTSPSPTIPVTTPMSDAEPSTPAQPTGEESLIVQSTIKRRRLDTSLQQLSPDVSDDASTSEGDSGLVCGPFYPWLAGLY